MSRQPAIERRGMERSRRMSGPLAVLWIAAWVWSTAGSAQAREAWQASAQDPPAVTHDDNPSEPTAFAASELRRYLGRILGVELPTAPTGNNGSRIHLSVVRDPELTDEGYELHVDDDAVLHITGGGDLGLIFGTYEFLRRYGGCRFSDLGPDGEHVPRKERIQADAGPLRMKPKLWYRGLQFGLYEGAELTRQRIDWMAKNGMNYVLYMPAPDGSDPKSLATIDPRTAESVPPERRGSPGAWVSYSKAWFDREIRPAVRRRGMKLDMNHHNLRYWLPVDRYFAEHPDWYSLIDGKRGKHTSQLCICTSNQNAVTTLIDNVRAYLHDNPEVKIVGVIQEDGLGMCQCGKCVASDENPKDAFRGLTYAENRSKTRRYAKLLNAVARAIRDDFPDVLVGGAAYVDMVYPPRDVALEPNTTVWVALYWRDGCRPIASENTSDLNKRFSNTLQQWKDVYRGRLIVYAYYMGMSVHRSMPYPQWEVICEDWTQMKRLGIGGATIQCWTSNHSVYALNLLAFAECGWHDQVDPSKLLDDYLLGAYGSVADEIRPIFAGFVQAMRDRARQEGELLPNGVSGFYFLEQVGREKIRQALRAARQEAASDGERRQVEKLGTAVGYWEMAADFYDARRQANRLSESDPKAALALLEKVRDQDWPKLQKYMATSAPPGWLGLTASRKSYWGIERLTKNIAALGKQASADSSSKVGR